MRGSSTTLASLIAFSLLLSPGAAQDIGTPRPKPDGFATGTAPQSPPLGGLLDGPLIEDDLSRSGIIGGALTSGDVLAPAVPYAPAVTPQTGMPDVGGETPVYLVARLSEDSPALTDGVSWHIYADAPGPDGELELLATAKGGDADFRLKPGSYLVHAAFGYAGRTSRLDVGNDVTSRTMLLNAGGMRLDAEFSGDDPIMVGNVRFDILEREFDSRGERKIVASNVAPGQIVRLNSDTYHVVSRYGDINATVRADIYVEPGKLTQATIYHNAARVTLKLVDEPGGEALANTAWSILTPGGDMVAEASGAFPAFILASGEYQVIARNADQLFSRDFTVNTARHGEVEVLTSQILLQ